MLNSTPAAYRPGSNMKWNVPGGNWSYLLPTRELEQVVSLGMPPATTLETLASIGRRVLIVCQDERELEQTRLAAGRSGMTNVLPMLFQADQALPLAPESVDLVFLTAYYTAHLVGQGGAWGSGVARVLKPNGLVYCEFTGPGDPTRRARALGQALGALRPAQLFWLTPRLGEMQTGVPLEDRDTISYFLRHALFGVTARNPVFRSVEGVAGRYLANQQWARRYGVLLSRDAAPAPGPPPQYLCALARNAGVDIAGCGWGLVASAEYESRKVLMYLYDRSSGSPAYIVKMTRKPNMNPRLENACRALEWLRQRSIGSPETVPRVAFTGCHQGLRIVGETVIQGAPFLKRTRWSAHCPCLRAATDWITELGASTSEARIKPADAGQALEQLLTRVAEIYSLSPGEQDFLADQAARASRAPGPLPLVFRHGDAGTWNAMVTLTGRVALLDWETAEQQGMPLWDLFYFLRSYCVRTARRHGVRDRLRGFTREFLMCSPLASFAAEATWRYCDQVALPRHFIEPLFYACWMHRALEEAPLLAPDRVNRGHYINLLRLCIREHSAPNLVKLFSP